MVCHSRGLDLGGSLLEHALRVTVVSLGALALGGCYTGAPDTTGDEDYEGGTSATAVVAADRPPGRGPTAADAGDPRAWPPGEPANRSSERVCARWEADRDSFGRMPAWGPGANSCAPGQIPAQTREGGVRVTNTFRWLAGLQPLREDRSLSTAAQACAVLLERNGQLTHHPPRTWTCWNSLASDTAGRSNLIGARGFVMTPWAAVSGWIDEGRDLSRTLGHRRWMLLPSLATVGYGQTSGYACLDVVSGRPSGERRSWTAWPNAGPVPSQAMTRIWSFSSATLGITSATRVRVTQGGVEVPVTARLQPPGYGEDTVSWEVWPTLAGATYRVRVTGLRAGDVTYDVRPVPCR